MDEGEGICLSWEAGDQHSGGKFLAGLVDHEVEPPSASGALDIELSACDSDYGWSVGECPLAEVISINLHDTS